VVNAAMRVGFSNCNDNGSNCWYCSNILGSFRAQVALPMARHAAMLHRRSLLYSSGPSVGRIVTCWGGRRDGDTCPTPATACMESSHQGRVRAKDGWSPSRCGLEGHWVGRMPSERSVRCRSGSQAPAFAVPYRWSAAPRSNLGSHESRPRVSACRPVVSCSISTAD
jgi:hypothetical protein